MCGSLGAILAVINPPRVYEGITTLGRLGGLTLYFVRGASMGASRSGCPETRSRCGFFSPS
jgi:hypothetical protein